MSGEEKVLTGKYFPKIRIDILTIVERVNLLSKNPALTLGACSSKGRIVSASRQIFRADFRPQDEIFRPGMPFPFEVT